MKDEQHRLVSAIKQLAAELDKTPSRTEFLEYTGESRALVDKCFGGYSLLIEAAGLKQRARNSKLGKLSNKIFEVNLEEALENHVPRRTSPRIPNKKILIIPDTHFPFHSKMVIDAIIDFASKNRPEIIIQIGDLYDLYAHSKYPRSQNIYSPHEEEKLARAFAEDMWKRLKEAAPNARLIQLKGNHDIRPLRRTLESLPSLEHVVSKYLDELMKFEGVELISDSREELIIDDIMFHHGYLTRLGGHRDYNLHNIVVGHTHKGGVVFRRVRGETIWELNCGFAGDPDAKVFGYRPQKMDDTTPGFGWIDEHGPRFILL